MIKINMRIKILLKTFSFIVMVFSLILLIPLLVALIYGEQSDALDFLEVAVSSFLIALLIFFFARNTTGSLTVRDGFLVVTVSWLLISIIGAVPYVISSTIKTYPQAFFETISGFSTTGASILNNIEGLSKSMLFWRSFTQWIGGMGIIVLAVALLPMLGVGGFNLMKAEAPGPEVDRVTSNISKTALILWGVYVSMTVIQAILLFASGMTLFDAINHSFTTIATGGYSTKNNSIAYYDSPVIQWIIIIFMFLGGVNFLLYYKVLTGDRFEFLKIQNLLHILQ